MSAMSHPTNATPDPRSELPVGVPPHLAEQYRSTQKLAEELGMTMEELEAASMEPLEASVDDVVRWLERGEGDF